MSEGLLRSDNQASSGESFACPRCGNQNPPHSIICWMCSYEFVDEATRNMIYQEAKKEAEMYRKNTPLRLRQAHLMEYYRSIGATRTDLIFDGFCLLSTLIGIVGGLLYLLLQVL